MLNERQKKALENAMRFCDHQTHYSPANCCRGLEWTSIGSFWPALYKNEKGREQTQEFILKSIEDKIKVSSIHYKIHKKTNLLSAFLLKYSNDIQTPFLKAKDETEDDLLTVLLSKRIIASVFKKRINRNTMGYQFNDQDGKQILMFESHSFQMTHPLIPVFMDDSRRFEVVEGNIFLY